MKLRFFQALTIGKAKARNGSILRHCFGRVRRGSIDLARFRK